MQLKTEKYGKEEGEKQTARMEEPAAQDSGASLAMPFPFPVTNASSKNI